jgi:hypothetical protein
LNSADAARNVYVDGALVCVLEPDESCATSITAGEDAVIHVTDLSDGEVCHDPRASLFECACLTLEILC